MGPSREIADAGAVNEPATSVAGDHALDAAVGAFAGHLPTRRQLRVEATFRQPTQLHPWLGSMLHGALGWALEEVACHPRCRALHAAEPMRCAVARLLGEPSADGVAPHLSGEAPKALALVPPAPAAARLVEAGDSFSFGVRLFGMHDEEDLEALRVALRRMGTRGFGRDRASALIDVAVEPSRPPTGPTGWANVQPPGRVRIAARTPLNLRRRGRAVVDPGLADMLFFSARRLAALSAFWGGGDTALRLDHFLRRPEDPAERRAWRLFSAQRYSARQRRRHGVSGVTGECEGNATADEASILSWGAEVGIGKSTAMGFGAFDVERLE
jgi:hypothetical protein